MKTKVLLMHLDAETITKLNLTLNNLNSTKFNGIISMNVPDDRIFRDTLPIKVGNMFNTHNQIVVENIYSDTNKTLLQRVYHHGSERVFIRLGYPKDFVVNSATLEVGTEDYNYTAWLEDSFDKNALSIYLTKNDILYRFLEATPDVIDKIDNKFFKYIRHLENNEDLNGTNFKTGFYSINGPLVNGPIVDSVEGMLEVYITSDINFFILYVTSAESNQSIYIRTYYKGVYSSWWKSDTLPYYQNAENHLSIKESFYQYSAISGSYLSAGTGMNASNVRMTMLSPDDAPIYTMMFPTSFTMQGTFPLVGQYGIARREWKLNRPNGILKNADRWG